MTRPRAPPRVESMVRPLDRRILSHEVSGIVACSERLGKELAICLFPKFDKARTLRRFESPLRLQVLDRQIEPELITKRISVTMVRISLTMRTDNKLTF